MAINHIEIINSVGEVIGLAALIFTNVFLIRSIMIISSIIFLITGYFIGLQSMAFWSFFYIIVNITQLILLNKENKKVEYNPTQKKLSKYLVGFSEQEFLKVYTMGAIEHYAPHQLQNADPKHIRFILQGDILIHDDSHKKYYKPNNHFIGHYNLLAKKTNKLNLENNRPVSCISWRKEDLLLLKVQSPSLFAKIIEALGIDLYLQYS